MRTRTLIALALPVALIAWLAAPSTPAPEPNTAALDTGDDYQWSRSEEEQFMCTIGYVQC